MIPVIVFGQYQYHQKDFSGILGALLWTIAWTIYLSVSRRVKATYGVAAHPKVPTNERMDRKNEHFRRVEPSIGYESPSDHIDRPQVSESSQSADDTYDQSSWVERLIVASRPWGTIALILSTLVFGLFQLYTGYVGMELQWGQGWAAAGMLCAFFLRITIPLMIGSYFYATDVWGWEWYFALLYIFPGLLFMLPMVAGGVISWLRDRFSR